MRVGKKPQESSSVPRPPTGWLECVTFSEVARVMPPEEGVWVPASPQRGRNSHYSWAWCWFPHENQINHGVSIDAFRNYWAVAIWGPEHRSLRVTLPEKPSDEQIRSFLRIVWGDLYGIG